MYDSSTVNSISSYGWYLYFSFSRIRWNTNFDRNIPNPKNVQPFYSISSFICIFYGLFPFSSFDLNQSKKKFNLTREVIDAWPFIPFLYFSLSFALSLRVQTEKKEKQTKCTKWLTPCLLQQQLRDALLSKFLCLDAVHAQVHHNRYADGRQIWQIVQYLFTKWIKFLF